MRILAALIFAMAGTTLAQGGVQADVVPQYRSAFDGYRPFADEPLKPWREVNDNVRRLGGHMGHVEHQGHMTAPASRAGGESAAPRPVPEPADTAPAKK